MLFHKLYKRYLKMRQEKIDFFVFCFLILSCYSRVLKDTYTKKGEEMKMSKNVQHINNILDVLGLWIYLGGVLATVPSILIVKLSGITVSSMQEKYFFLVLLAVSFVVWMVALWDYSDDSQSFFSTRQILCFFQFILAWYLFFVLLGFIVVLFLPFLL